MDGAFKMTGIWICYRKKNSRIKFFSFLYDSVLGRSFLTSFISSYILTESPRANCSKKNMIALISKTGYSWSRQLINLLFFYFESRKLWQSRSVFNGNSLHIIFR